MDADGRPRGTPTDGAGGFWTTRRWWARLGQTMVASTVAAALTMVSVVIAARALGPEGYGVVVLAIAVTGVVARFLDFTLEEAVIHHGHRALAAGDLAGLRALLRTSLTLDIGVGVAIAGALALVAVPLAEVAAAGGIDPTLVRLAALGVLVVTADGTTSAVLLVAGRPHLRAWVYAGASLFRVVGTVVAVALGGGAEAILVSYALSGAAGGALLGLVAWRVAWRDWARAPRAPRPVSASRLLRFGFHTSASTSVDALGESLFPVILGNLAGPGAVGIFRVAMLPVLASQMLSRPLRLMLLPEQAKLHAERKPGTLKQAMIVYSVACTAVALPVAVAAWFAMPALMELLFSQSFEEAVPAARILLAAAVIQFVLAWSKQFHAAVGRPHIRTRLTALHVILSLSLLLLLGERGVEGAALAFTIAGAVTASVWVPVAYRYLAREEALVASGVPGAGRPAGGEALASDGAPLDPRG